MVQIVVGRCPKCGGTIESATGLRGRFCAIGHDVTPYVYVDNYFETFEDSLKDVSP